MNKLSTDLLKPKQHFEIQDGLRGIAAVSFVVFHFMEIVHSANLFGFNAPSWSLFWEYVANIFYALILIRTDYCAPG